MIEVDSRATTWTAGGAVTQRGGGPRFEVAIGRHLVTLDQPAGEGGEDAGPTPTEAFVMSLAACAAHYAHSYLAHHGLPAAGLSAAYRWRWAADAPHRVGAIEIDLTLPEGVPEERREAVLRAAGRCAVHNSVIRAPEMVIR